MTDFKKESPMSTFWRRYRQQKEAASKPNAWVYRIMSDIQLYGKPQEHNTDPYERGGIVGRAMGDLQNLLKMSDDRYRLTPVNYLFRNAVRALYQSGNLHTSKTAATLIDRSLKKLEGTDKFEYAMSKRLVELMLSEK